MRENGQGTLGEFKNSDVGLVPKNWEVVEAGDLEPFITSGSRGWAKYYSDRGAPFLRITNLTRELIYPDLEDLIFVDLPSTETEASRTTVKDGDVLISITADIGIIGFVNPNIQKPAYINQHIACLRIPPEKADGRFLSYYLASQAPQRRFAEMTDIGAKSGINLTTVSKLKLVCPPLSEQRAIAAALGDVDGLIGALEALIAKKRDIKQAAMQQLLTGKTRLPGFKGEWDDLTFGEIFQFLRNGSNSRAQLSSNGDVGYVHYGDVHAAATGFMNCAQGEIPRIASGLVQGLPRVRDGDLIIADASEDYAGVGKSVEVTGIGNDEVVAGLHTILLRGDPTMIADGFKGYLQEIPAVKTALIRIANGISVYGISKSGVKGVSVRLPSPAEQTAIASVLSDMDAEIAALEARRDKTRALKQGMMQELLTGRIRLV